MRFVLNDASVKKYSILDNQECAIDDHDCHPNATCHNTEGSFTCQCKPGHTGDGKTCSGRDQSLFLVSII